MPAFPQQGGSRNTWGTELRSFFSAFFSLSSGKIQADSIDLAAGAIPFGNASGSLSQDGSRLFWDAANKKFNISTTEPNLVLTSTAVGGVQYQLNSGGGLGFSLGDFTISDQSQGGVAFRIVKSALNNNALVIKNGNIGIGILNPNANAILDVPSTTKAAMFPRMTTTQRDAIPSPTEGMEIYNLTTHVKDFYNGTAWGPV